MSNESGERITRLRKDIRRETQADFGKALGVGQTMVSGLEGGEAEPSCAMYLRLGNLAPYPDNLWFWERAGLDAAAMESSVGKLLRERGSAPVLGESVRLRCYIETGHGTRAVDREITFPAEFVRDPSQTVCVVIDEETRSEWLPAGDLVVLDNSDRDATDLTPFWNETVIVNVDLERPSGYAALHMGTWSGGSLIGKLRLKRIHRPGDLPARPIWVATVGPPGDSDEQHREGQSYHPVGHWDPSELRPMPDDYLEYMRLHGSGGRSEHGKLKRLEAMLHSQALAQMRLEEAYCILGRMIAWIKPRR